MKKNLQNLKAIVERYRSRFFHVNMWENTLNFPDIEDDVLKFCLSEVFDSPPAAGHKHWLGLGLCRNVGNSDIFS